jgi:dephospho-CoA kinase
MSGWPAKYVIGLTGNIATGKSVIRKMLEHLGAYGIDADALSHRAIAKGAPGYRPAVETFGTWILADDQQIDRSRLGKLVFSDPQALKLLEAIIHPLVRQAVDILVRRSKQKVIVLEAIKLLESPLRENCDTIFVSAASPEIQLSRLVQKRGMTREAAQERISAQSPQEVKLAAADFIIRNEGSFEDTWRQVQAAWLTLFPEELKPAPRRAHPAGKMYIERARPQDAGQIVEFITRIQSRPVYPDRETVMAAFGEKAFMLLKTDQKIAGMAGWQVENLVARTNDVYFDPAASFQNGMQLMMERIESASRDLQCEVHLLFLPPRLARKEDLWQSLGYQLRTINDLGVRAWQEAAVESMPHGTVMLFKQLRKDRVLRPV